ncbi:MAG: hypothetical protein ACYSSN_11505 [Planctomycetota bacterium]
MGLIFGIPLAVLGAALLVGGIVGYRKYNSSPAKVISAAAAAAGLASWLIVLLVTPVFQSSPDSPEPSISYKSMVGNYETLVSKLSAEGAVVEQGDEISQPFFSVPGKTATINGDDLQVYEYLSEKTVEEESATVSSTGSSIGPNMVSWIKPPHFFRSGKIIVIYLGTNADTINLLEEILGEQFAGQ